jgi:hypothetical protein
MPLVVNDSVTSPNVGEPCTAQADCFSPFGLGRCVGDDDAGTRVCTVASCASPWFDDGFDDGFDSSDPAATPLCGAGAACVAFDPSDPLSSLCLETCVSAATCAPGLGCIPGPDDDRVCWFGCGADGDCKEGERCESAGMPSSRCVSE